MALFAVVVSNFLACPGASRIRDTQNSLRNHDNARRACAGFQIINERLVAQGTCECDAGFYSVGELVSEDVVSVSCKKCGPGRYDLLLNTSLLHTWHRFKLAATARNAAWTSVNYDHVHLASTVLLKAIRPAFLAPQADLAKAAAF